MPAAMPIIMQMNILANSFQLMYLKPVQTIIRLEICAIALSRALASPTPISLIVGGMDISVPANPVIACSRLAPNNIIKTIKSLILNIMTSSSHISFIFNKHYSVYLSIAFCAPTQINSHRSIFTLYSRNICAFRH